MLDKEQISKGIIADILEIKSRPKADVLEYVAEKLAELYVMVNSLAIENEVLKNQVNQSELFFSLPEVNLITKSKLPHVLIEAGDVVPIGDNFYKAEPYGSNSYIRWTGPDRLNIFAVPIDRSVVRTMRLHIISAVKPEIISSIKIYLDGELIDTELEVRGDTFEIVASLPISDRVQDTQISMFIPQLYSPVELNPDSVDNRKLGVAFHQLEVV